MTRLAKPLDKPDSTSLTTEAVYLCYLPVRIGVRSIPNSSTKMRLKPCDCHTQSYTERIALDGFELPFLEQMTGSFPQRASLSEWLPQIPLATMFLLLASRA